MISMDDSYSVDRNPWRTDFVEHVFFPFFVVDVESLFTQFGGQ